ncbi:mechanosensitive ion channel family protein [Amorphus orientalis]|uniref:Small-conductance mechanosensitive channel n=1 Tax=Amorphus orientalis TaxID=649198 RepID=A0AAE3VNT1_9HYPH|nr:mechanosensitive ion channel domain-containing protein [Amorphus orientalis]MDQ0315337.1 small-conductance mechanosensitive channel [Amorphus orientalis]
MVMTGRSTGLWLVLFLVLCGFGIAAGPVQAQEAAAIAAAEGGSGSSDSDESAASVASELAPLTAEQRSALIGKMTDSQARDLLLYYLSENAPAADAASTAQGHTAAASLKLLQAKGTALRKNLAAVLSQFGNVIGDYVGKMQERLRVSVGQGGLLLVFGTILGLALAGVVVEAVYRFLTRSMVSRYEAAPMDTVRQKLSRAFGQLLHGLGAIVAFALGYVGVFFVIWGGDVPRRDFLIVVLLAILITRVTVAVVRFVFLPNHPAWRIMPVDDEAAAHFVRGTRRQVTLGVVLLLFGTLGRMWGVEPDIWRLGCLLSAILFTASFSFFLWRYRRHALRTLRAAIGSGGVPAWAQGAAGWSWYGLALGYVMVAFLIGVYALLMGLPFDPIKAAAGFLVLFVLNPYLSSLGKLIFMGEEAVATAKGPMQIVITDPDDGERMVMTRSDRGSETATEDQQAEGTADAEPKEMSEASKAVLRDKRVLGRVISISALVISLALFAFVIGVDAFSSTHEYPIAQFAIRVLLNIGVIALLSYVAWAMIAAWIDRKLAQEEANKPEGQVSDDGPGGPAGTRLQTILPIFRRAVQIIILVMAVMVVLSAMGVNIAPLIAGAGIFGLAIGFGSQTLVKDLISGLFFLMDDAFRIGEYIEASGTAGTVERFNARSLVLRGYLGAVYTVPYGDLGKVTNYSRDWVIMKLRFRVPYDTDIDKVRKIFKKIGQELLEDPDIGPDFLQPFKSQGVIKMDDSAFIVSGKFMAKPNRQWGIRKAVYQKVQKAFQENDIHFAPKRVIVDVPNAAEMEDHDPQKAATTRAAAAAAVASDDAAEKKTG